MATKYAIRVEDSTRDLVTLLQSGVLSEEMEKFNEALNDTRTWYFVIEIQMNDPVMNSYVLSKRFASEDELYDDDGRSREELRWLI